MKFPTTNTIDSIGIRRQIRCLWKDLVEIFLLIIFLCPNFDRVRSNCCLKYLFWIIIIINSAKIRVRKNIIWKDLDEIFRKTPYLPSNSNRINCICCLKLDMKIWGTYLVKSRDLGDRYGNTKIWGIDMELDMI